MACKSGLQHYTLTSAAWKVQADEEIASGTHTLDPTFPRTGPRSARSRPQTPLPRRSSASNMQDHSVSKGVHGTSGITRRSSRDPTPVTRWSPTHDGTETHNGCRADDVNRSGDEGPTVSLHSQEGDTEAANTVSLYTQGAACPGLVCYTRHTAVKHKLVDGMDLWCILSLTAHF